MPADMRLELLSFWGHIFGTILLNVVPTLYYLLKVVWVPLVFSAVCTVLEDHSIFWCFWQTRAWIQVFFLCQASIKFCFSVLNQTWHTGNWFHESNKHDTKPRLLRFGSVGLETRSTGQVQTWLTFHLFEGLFQICLMMIIICVCILHIYNICIQVSVKMRIISYQITKILV